MSTEGKPREVKVVLLGDTGVGKSSLVLRFVTNNFKPYSESTIGASFMSKMIMVSGKPIKFQVTSCVISFFLQYFFISTIWFMLP